jgi:membrane protein insertase Oxa1/YidC/SpoIIIJ
MGKGQIFLFSKCHFQTFPCTIPCWWVHPSIRNLLLLSCVWTTSELPWWCSTLVVTYIVNLLLLPHTT